MTNVFQWATDWINVILSKHSNNVEMFLLRTTHGPIDMFLVRRFN